MVSWTHSLLTMKGASPDLAAFIASSRRWADLPPMFLMPWASHKLGLRKPFLRTISRTNKDESKVTYVQLAHNVWDPKSRCAKAEVVHTFGRTDALDVAALKRLAQSICLFLCRENTLAVQGSLGEPSVRFVKSAPMRGAYLLRNCESRSAYRSSSAGA